MFKSLKIVLLPLALVVIASFFLGEDPAPPVTLLWPAGTDTASYDQGKLAILSVLKDSTPNFVVSTQWSVTRFIDVNSKSAKDNFPKEFYGLFPPGVTLQQMIYTYQIFNAYLKPETLNVAYTDTVSIRALWKMPSMTTLAKGVQTREVMGVIVSLCGWKDSTYAAVYDDPNNADRALYKVHIQLIPGINRIYFGRKGERSKAVEYTTVFAPGSPPDEESAARFHNSMLEQSCVTCHDGLPSSDNGASMKADCTVCHKTFSGAVYQHAPVEMKECSSCHSWSAEKKMMVVAQGVPATCYTCHDTRKEQVENSPTPHPVAGECLTCHSQHGTDRKHMLKADVYDLCTGCHEDQKLNHPVGRHPLRFKTVPATGEEISCVSCHDPHGTKGPHLLKIGTSTMEVCTQCH